MNLVKLKRASPTIMTCIGAVGVAATVVEAVRATPKAMLICSELQVKKFEEDGSEPSKIDYVKASWKCYIPTAIFGLTTIAAIFASNGLNKKEQASLASAYAIADRALREYKKNEKLKTGSEENIAKVVVGNDSKLIFYDEYYGQFFEKTMAEVKDAEYELNKLLATKGEATINDFFRLLGLDSTFEPYDSLGWSKKDTCDNWIDFSHNLVEIDDMECCIIDMCNPPVMCYYLPF